MDYLDGNLHQSLLTALAANLASTSDQDDLALLTTSFSSLEPISNKAVNGVLSRMNGSSGAGEGELVTNDQLEGMIAFAEYSSKAEPNQVQASQVAKLLQGIPRWSLEPALGVQASYDWAPADRLAFALTDAAFHCADSNVHAREAVIKSIQYVQAELESQARHAPGPRTISYVLPALNGLRRAMTRGLFTWTASDPQPSILSFDDPSVAHLRSIFANSSDLELSSEEGRIALATLEKYQFAQPGLSPTLPLLASLEIQQAYWSSFLSPAKSSDARWKGMLVASGTQTDKLAMPQQIAAEGVAQKALEVWQRVVRAIETEDEFDDEVDLQPTPLLVASLTLAVTASVVVRKLEPDLLSILESVLHPESAGIDESIQVAGSQALQVIAHGFPERLSSATEIIRRFLLSPALRPSDDPSTLTPALQAATDAYSALLARSDSSVRTSAVQTLLNHLASIERQGHVPNGDSFVDAASTIGSVRRYGGDTAEVAANIAHVVSLLARKSSETSLVRLVGSTLLHYATNGSVLVQCAALIELCELAAVSDKHAYIESLRTVTSVARAATGGDDISYQTAISALNQLATIAAKKREELGFSFLTELLTLFGNKGVENAGSSEERTQMLLAIVSVLDSYLTQVSFDASSVISSALGALFRGFWYTCLLSGFLSSPQRLSTWQRSALFSVAKRSPPLVVGVSQDLVELEAQVQAILKAASSHNLSVEAIRGDLANGIPSQATHARSIPTPQAVFLATAYRLEALRAEAGAIAPLFLYLGVPALSGESPICDTLKSIGEKVLSVYMARLGQQVPLHAMDSSAYVQIRSILLHTTNSSESMRGTALRFLDNILSSFPSLVCNLGVVTVMLELLTVLHRACLDEYTDEYTPSFEFHSTRGNFTITLTDDYPLRNRILRNLHEHVRSWLKKGITRSPLEMQGLLQEYVDVTSDEYRMQMLNDDEMGKSVALDLVKTPPANGKYASLPAWGDWNTDASTTFARTFAAKSFFGGEAQRGATNPRDVPDKLEDLAEQLDKHKLHFKPADLRDLFYRGAAQIVKAPQPDFEVLRHVVSLPVRLYTEASIAVGQEIWTWMADARPELEPRVVSEVLEAWADTIEREHGLFSRNLDNDTPLNQETQFTPTDKEALNRDYLLANRLFSPMLAMLDFLQSRYQAYRYRNADLVYATLRLLLRTLQAHERWSRHPLSRELRLTLLSFGFTLVGGSRLESIAEYNLRAKLYDAAFAWFEVRPTWSFGNNRIQIKADLQAIDNLLQAVQADSPTYDVVSSSFEDGRPTAVLPGRALVSSAKEDQRLRQQLLKALLSDEAERLRLWLNPLLDSKRGAVPGGETPGVEELRKLARFAWPRWPEVVVFLHDRFTLPPVLEEVVRLIRSDPLAVQDCPDALPFFVGESLSLESRSKFRHLLYWAPVPVPEALRFLFPKFGGDPILLQYALRVLEHHPVSITFFYVPQVVQALRTDELGYAERFIFETCVSPPSAHLTEQPTEFL
ncbi:phosphatidylinositol 4-kinase [Rhodotorula toruloides]|uniref:1-phosphatidylinositol 4-kinase n=1 Tax=Rhodotorula toruloides TaxID=5286 RepID=A0A511KJ40_RHOTO|nr:phosphatidylinositol 4-kinase [Rhodotorula toruloides]